MVKRDQVLFWAWRLGVAVLCVSGCATTYRYATGQQAELQGRAGSWPWYSWHAFIAPAPTAPATDAGVYYEITTGETQAEIRAHLGEPRAIAADSTAAGNDIWEYPFATVRFRGGRVGSVTFTQSATGTSYYEKTWRLGWP